MVIAVDYSRQIILPGELPHNRAVIFYITDKHESLLSIGGLPINYPPRSRVLPELLELVFRIDSYFLSSYFNAKQL